MSAKFSFEGRHCWTAWGSGEFFGFAQQGEGVYALVRNESDDSVHLVDILKGDLRLHEADEHPPIESIVIKTNDSDDSDIYCTVCSFKNSDGFVKIVYIDSDGSVREKQYGSSAIKSIDITYSISPMRSSVKEDTNEAP